MPEKRPSPPPPPEIQALLRQCAQGEGDLFSEDGQRTVFNRFFMALDQPGDEHLRGEILYWAFNYMYDQLLKEMYDDRSPDSSAKL